MNDYSNLSDAELTKLYEQTRGSVGNKKSDSPTAVLSNLTDAELVAAYEKAKSERDAKPEERSTVAELARQVGLTVRAGVNGVAALPAMVSDAVTGPINAAADVVAGEGNGFRFKSASKSVNDLMTKAGLPQAENAQERVVQDAAAAVAGAGGIVGAGRAIAGAGGAVAKGVGNLLAAGPRLQAVSGAAGGGAAALTRENGGGEGAQMAAGLAGALAPGFAPAAGKAAVRGLLRGGEAGRVRVADNIEKFALASGETPTLGQATEGRVQQAVESALSKMPGSGGVMAKKAQKQLDGMSQSVQQLAEELAPGASAVNAGEAITRGIQSFKGGIKSVQQHLYGKLDKYMPPDTPVQAPATQVALKELTADIEGAPNLSTMFQNAKLMGISKSLQSDLDASAVSGTLPYRAVKALRSVVGRELTNNSLVPDVPRAQWSRLYGALSDDLGGAAKEAGPEAEAVWTWANSFTKSQLGRLEQLDGILARSTPEKIFSAAISGTAEGDTVIKRVVSALPKNDRKEVVAAVLQRLGRATPGQQNSMGDAFSSETFLTNLSKLSEPARVTLFGRAGIPELQTRVQAMADMASNIRDGSKVFANPSGTAQAISLKEAAIGAGAALATGNVGMAAAIGGGLGVANLAARFVTSPKNIGKLAQSTTLAEGARAAVVGAGIRADQLDTESVESGEFLRPLDPGAVPIEGVDAPVASPGAISPSAVPEVVPLSAPNPGDSEAAQQAEQTGEQSAGDAIGIPISQAEPQGLESQPQPQQPRATVADIGRAGSVDEAIAAAGAAINSPVHRQVAQAEPLPEPVKISMRDPAASSEPANVWFGRRGDGYESVAAASLALRSRERADPGLDWKMEQMPSGRIRLAGYMPEPTAEDTTAAFEQPSNSQQFEAVPMSNGAISFAGDQQQIKGMLASAGITSVPFRGQMLVGRSQAQAAMQAISASRATA